MLVRMKGRRAGTTTLVADKPFQASIVNYACSTLPESLPSYVESVEMLFENGKVYFVRLRLNNGQVVQANAGQALAFFEDGIRVFEQEEFYGLTEWVKD